MLFSAEFRAARTADLHSHSESSDSPRSRAGSSQKCLATRPIRVSLAWVDLSLPAVRGCRHLPAPDPSATTAVGSGRIGERRGGEAQRRRRVSLGFSPSLRLSVSALKNGRWSGVRLWCSWRFHSER